MKQKEPLLEINNVWKYFGGKLIFKNVNLKIYEKEIIGLLGLSGSGKTTLLNLICGFLKPSSGKINYICVTNSKQKYLKKMNLQSLIGFSTQKPSFYSELSIFENLAYFGSLYGIKKKTLYAKIDELLEILELKDFRNVLAQDLSEGMRKRLDIACSIVHEPKILILDEPTSNLDYKLREELITYIKKINKAGVTIIFVSHFLEEVEILCSKVLLISTQTKIINSVVNVRSKFETFLNEEEKSNIKLISEEEK